LPDVSTRRDGLAAGTGPILVMFICGICPYVIHIKSELANRQGLCRQSGHDRDFIE
jgi:hypothetical protein